MHWSFSYEDDIPLGRRINIVMGSEYADMNVRIKIDMFLNNQWINSEFTPGRLRDYVVGNENCDVYRLVIPDSSSSAGRARVSFASRFYNVLRHDCPVSGFIGKPIWQGPVAEKLQTIFRINQGFEDAGRGGIWGVDLSQYILDEIGMRFVHTPDSLIFHGRMSSFPANRRNEVAIVNFL